jgi:hypothetical protein
MIVYVSLRLPYLIFNLLLSWLALLGSGTSPKDIELLVCATRSRSDPAARGSCAGRPRPCWPWTFSTSTPAHQVGVDARRRGYNADR